MTKLKGEVLEHIKADLEERLRLKQLMHVYTYKAIGKRYGLSHNTIWYWAVANGLDDRANGLHKGIADE